MDYFFPGSEGSDAAENPMFFLADEENGHRYARMVEHKGLGEDGDMPLVVLDAAKEIRSWGHSEGDLGSPRPSYGVIKGVTWGHRNDDLGSQGVIWKHPSDSCGYAHSGSSRGSFGTSKGLFGVIRSLPSSRE